MPKTSAAMARQGRGGEVSLSSSGSKSANVSRGSRTATAVAEVPATSRRSGRTDIPRRRAEGSKQAAIPLSKMPTEKLWRDFRAVSDSPKSIEQKAQREELRNQLMQRFYEVVKYTAERMRVRLPAEVEVDDLMSAGLFGLMDAINAFDPNRGVKFETYCAQRVRGAIVDELRSMDWVPRLVRSRTSKVDRVRKQIEMQTGQRPTDSEVAERLNVSSDEFSKLCKDSRPVGVVSLNRKFFETDSSRDVREIDVIHDTRQRNPTELAQQDDLRSILTQGLSRSERLILILYYEEEMTMKEIGATLDLSESRVSQMHSSILLRLKARVSHRLKEV